MFRFIPQYDLRVLFWMGEKVESQWLFLPLMSGANLTWTHPVSFLVFRASFSLAKPMKMKGHLLFLVNQPMLAYNSSKCPRSLGRISILQVV